MKKVVPIHNWWWWAWFGFCALLSVGQLQKFPLTDSISAFVHDFVLVGWLGVAFFQHGAVLRKQLAQVPKVLLAFAVWAIAGLLIHQLQFGFVLTPFLYLARLAFYVFWLTDLRALISLKKLSPKDLVSGVLLCFGLVAWFGLLQYFLLPDTRVLLFLGWDDHYYRLISTLLDPAFTGLVLVWGWWLSTQTKILQQWGKLKWGVGALFLFTLLLTYSRSSYLAFGVGSLVILAKDIWQKKFAAAGIIGVAFAVFVVGIFLLPRPAGEGVRLERQSTVVARQENIVQTLKTFQPQTWVIGQGLFTPAAESVSTYVDHSRIPDNWLIWLLQGTGLVGLGLGIYWLGHLLWKAWRTNSVAAAMVLSVLVHSLFNASLSYPWTILLGGAALLGLLVVGNR